MNAKKRAYELGGLDVFRLAAALLVAAIHTSPLEDISAGADFFLTRILARIAVPFFFMVTGQFVLGGFGVASHVKKLALMYGGAVLLYLPIGIYAGHYEDIGIWGLLRMLLVDGTFYHLWYFPACILGIGVVCQLRRMLPERLLLPVCVLLYGMGLLGDSYFGLLAYAPGIKQAYELFFQISSYTRNGLFFAPLFLLMGWKAGETWGLKKGKLTEKPIFLAAASLAFFGLMTVEGFTLRFFGLQRHDSMYVMLAPCMYFLYRWIMVWQIRQRRELRTVSAWFYVLHPAVIVVVRGAAGVLGLTGVLVENSLVHYLAVCVGSLAASVVLLWMGRAFSRKRKDRERAAKTARAWITLDRQALRRNVAVLRENLPKDCELMPAVKADAYGHGAALIARELAACGVGAFCVAEIGEGIALRKAGVRGDILVLGYTAPQEASQLIRYGLTQTVIDLSYAKGLNECLKRRLPVHIALDTGMHRLGVPSGDMEALREIFGMKRLSVKGIFTHLCADDTNLEEDKAYTRMQARRFFQTVERLSAEGFDCGKIHLTASYGVVNYPALGGDYARVGIALYGVLSTKKDSEECRLPLSPVLSLKARVALIKKLHKGEAAGYGRAFVAEREMTIGVVTIGYGDGLPRSLSCGKGAVLIRGRRAPILGRICMDQTIVDVSDIKDVCPGDIAVVIGRSGEEEIGAGDVAEWSGSITNEVLSRLGKRLERVID